MEKRTTKSIPPTGRLRRALTAVVLVLVTALLLIVHGGTKRREPTTLPEFPQETVIETVPVEPPAIPAELTLQSTPSESLIFFLSKLGDTGYTETYGDGFTWYIAAEELGLIGLPAIPHLIEKLDTDEDYERTQVLYALRLAAQHANMRTVTGGEYVELSPDAFPPPEVHAELAGAWREWYGHYFVPSP